jgi:hypothetical protein
MLLFPQRGRQVLAREAEMEGQPAHTTMRLPALLLCLLAPVLLLGCDALGVETATAVNARKEAEGRAIGSACRHAVRSIESCFQNNPRAGKAAVFAGWREMDQYMRENNVVGMPSEDASSSQGSQKPTS